MLKSNSSSYSFFSKKTVYALGGGLFLGGSAAALIIVALRAGLTLSPWLLLIAVPYFLLGAGLGYTGADSLPPNAGQSIKNLFR